MSPAIIVLAAMGALAAAILAFIFIIPAHKRPGLNKFMQFVHDVCNFKFLIIEKIVQFLYVLSTAFSITLGFFMLFWFETYRRSTEWYGYYGLLLMVVGPIAVRIAYEILMLGLLAIKNIIQINNKLKNQNEDDAATDPFATPSIDFIQPSAPAAPVAPVAPAVMICPTCGAPKNVGEFCSNCGTR